MVIHYMSVCNKVMNGKYEKLTEKQVRTLIDWTYNDPRKYEEIKEERQMVENL